jgi:hypothetical protein
MGTNASVGALSQPVFKAKEDFLSTLNRNQVVELSQTLPVYIGAISPLTTIAGSSALMSGRS